MSEYLVRWKFGPDSLLNHRNVDTHWYQQPHSTKKDAIQHYLALLNNSTVAMAMTAEVIQMVKILPGQPVTNDAVEEQVAANKEPEEVVADVDKRNNKILDMFNKGYTRRAIADKTGLPYQTVYGIIKRLNK